MQRQRIERIESKRTFVKPFYIAIKVLRLATYLCYQLENKMQIEIELNFSMAKTPPQNRKWTLAKRKNIKKADRPKAKSQRQIILGKIDRIYLLQLQVVQCQSIIVRKYVLRNTANYLYFLIQHNLFNGNFFIKKAALFFKALYFDCALVDANVAPALFISNQKSVLFSIYIISDSPGVFPLISTIILSGPGLYFL